MDAKTCKLIVLDQRIESMIEFKQIVGRGTRIHEDAGKFWFTIMDFKKATELFADPQFDGEPIVIYEPGEGDGEEDDRAALGEMTVTAKVVVTRVGNRRSAAARADQVHRERRRSSVVAERVQYYGNDGKLITESLTDYTKKTVTSVSPRSTISSGTGARRSGRPPSSKSCASRACCLRSCKTKSTRISTLSTSSATSLSTVRRSPGASEPRM